MIRLIRAEFLKLRTTQVWFWLLLGTVAVSTLVVVLQIAPSSGISSSADVPDLFAGFVVPPASGYILVFVLGVLSVTTEFRYQTITPTLLQTPSRWRLVTAKMISYTLLGALYALVVVVIEAVVGIPWLKAKRGISVDLGNSEVLHSTIGTFAVVALFGIIGLGIGALLRNQIAAVTVGVIFLLLLQQILIAIPGAKHAYPYMPGGGTLAIVVTHGSRSVNGAELLSTTGGVVVLLLWAFVPAILGAAITLNRDIT